jgi:endogenous inhibitor of DNA gyrase (YacG/DUF329 family)
MNCVTCGTLLDGQWPGRRFCSRACYLIDHGADGVGESVMPLLYGWKAIAASLGFSERKARSLVAEGLPVRKVRGGQTRPVVADPVALDRWSRRWYERKTAPLRHRV